MEGKERFFSKSIAGWVWDLSTKYRGRGEGGKKKIGLNMVSKRYSI